MVQKEKNDDKKKEGGEEGKGDERVKPSRISLTWQIEQSWLHVVNNLIVGHSVPNRKSNFLRIFENQFIYEYSNI